MRSGTSMMMQALEAGGMDAAYSKERNERMNSKLGDPDLPRPYFPNESYHELEPDDYRSPDFPYSYEGKLIKCLWGGITKIRPKKEGSEGYKVIFMRRSREAIEESLIKMFGYATDFAANPAFDYNMDSLVELVRDRRSIVSVTEVWFGDVVADPLKEFTRIKEAGWPIDPEKAAMIPSDKKMRSAA